ncbi:GyrI-like domain-containing protein [Lacinutrix neustonica]|uniref:GyrI-like domain-containing protein n=1 Tax=Lacinutrix neustonica TaxID=2980107 RepID=A0A9E8SDR0_9FLAO|nr:GyrI-like domain-containing protein [Lacinutrix neustonica]WAC02027.1 GyrI-like domain-containing protein [Lacinutrix neustonica]
MTCYNLQGGLYAVFRYKGLVQDFSKLLQYIFTEWMPKSQYTLDHRAHFQVLGEHYKKDSPDSQEDVYIPIRLK